MYQVILVNHAKNPQHSLVRALPLKGISTGHIIVQDVDPVRPGVELPTRYFSRTAGHEIGQDPTDAGWVVDNLAGLNKLAETVGGTWPMPGWTVRSDWVDSAWERFMEDAMNHGLISQAQFTGGKGGDFWILGRLVTVYFSPGGQMRVSWDWMHGETVYYVNTFAEFYEALLASNKTEMANIVSEINRLGEQYHRLQGR
jgi:hypothetical protein